MKPDYVIAIDGGGSKTIGRIERVLNGEGWEYRGGPSSLTNDFDQAQREIRRGLITLLERSQATPSDCVVIIGVAGAGNEALRIKLQNAIALEFHHLCVTTDARIALYGARRGKPVVAIALGTGSVAMCLDEKQTETVAGGWGFAIADEGSGAALGKAALRLTLWEIDQFGTPRSATGKWVASQVGDTRAAILNWIKQAGAKQFGEWAPRILQLKNACEVAGELTSEHAREVERLIHVARGEKNLPVVLLGGLAVETYPLLSAETQRILMRPEGTALDGALYLARQARNQNLIAATSS